MQEGAEHNTKWGTFVDHSSKVARTEIGRLRKEG